MSLLFVHTYTYTAHGKFCLPSGAPSTCFSSDIRCRDIQFAVRLRDTVELSEWRCARHLSLRECCEVSSWTGSLCWTVRRRRSCSPWPSMFTCSGLVSWTVSLTDSRGRRSAMSYCYCYRLFYQLSPSGNSCPTACRHRRVIRGQRCELDSPAVKSKNILLCGEIMKLGTLIQCLPNVISNEC